MAKLPSNEKWETILEDCLSEHGYSTFRLTITPDEKSKPCSGDMLKVLVEGRKNRDFKIEFLMMKALREPQENASMFKTESFIYNEVMPKFEKMQTDLARSDKFEFPFCYKSTAEYIIMEDLTIRNFALEPEMLTFEQTAMALTYLGMFHAFSFALRFRNNDDFESWTKDLNKDYFSSANVNNETMKDAIELAVDSLDDMELKNKIKKALVESKYQQPQVDYKSTVICHGDFTSKNLLFSIDEDLEPTGVIMIDYQLSNVASPVTDVQTLILSSSTPEVIMHYDRLVDIYYDSLRLFLKKFQCLIKDCYLENVFQADLKAHLHRSLVRMLLTSKNSINNDGVSKYNGNWYKKRINDVIKVLSDIELL